MKTLPCFFVIVACVVSSFTLEHQSKLSEESPLISLYYKTEETVNTERKSQRAQHSSTNHERNVDGTTLTETGDSVPRHVQESFKYNLDAGAQADTVPELQVGCEKGFVDNEKKIQYKNEEKEKVEKTIKQKPIVHYSSNRVLKTLVRHKRDTRGAPSRVSRQTQGINPSDLLSQLRHHNGNSAPIIYVVGTSNWCVNGPSLLVPLPYNQNPFPYFPYFPQQFYPQFPGGTQYPQFPPQYFPGGQNPTVTQSPPVQPATPASGPGTGLQTTLTTDTRFGIPTTTERRPNWGEVATTTTRRPPTQQTRTRRPMPLLFHNSKKDGNINAVAEYNPPTVSPPASIISGSRDTPIMGLRPQIEIGNEDVIAFLDNPRQMQQSNRRPSNSLRPATTVRPTTTTTSRPPSMGNDPSRCVWAIVSCCSGSSDTISYACFENLGCRGAFWDISPCSREFALAALTQTMQFYDRN